MADNKNPCCLFLNQTALVVPTWLLNGDDGLSLCRSERDNMMQGMALCQDVYRHQQRVLLLLNFLLRLILSLFIFQIQKPSNDSRAKVLFYGFYLSTGGSRRRGLFKQGGPGEKHHDRRELSRKEPPLFNNII